MRVMCILCFAFLQSSIPHGFKLEFQNLEEEVCSLRTVLDLKHSEIQDLRKQNEKLHRDVQDLPFVLQKLDSAQARVEDLNAQMAAKVENEKLVKGVILKLRGVGISVLGGGVMNLLVVFD